MVPKLFCNSQPVRIYRTDVAQVNFVCDCAVILLLLYFVRRRAAVQKSVAIPFECVSLHLILGSER